jgi:hypothetical protein
MPITSCEPGLLETTVVDPSRRQDMLRTESKGAASGRPGYESWSQPRDGAEVAAMFIAVVDAK